eukprot:94252-Amorphochlora_amoeboformis.AAC.2
MPFADQPGSRNPWPNTAPSVDGFNDTCLFQSRTSTCTGEMPPTDSLKDPAVAIAEMYRSLIPDIGGSLKEITNIENEKYVLPSAMLTNVFGFHRNVTKTYRFGRKLGEVCGYGGGGGEGAYAFVVKARNVYTGRSVAVKILD